MPELFDVIELTIDIPEQELYAGMQGTIVASHPGDAYEVEFADESGETLALLALRPHQFIVVWRASTGAPVSVAEQVTALMKSWDRIRPHRRQRGSQLRIGRRARRSSRRVSAISGLGDSRGAPSSSALPCLSRAWPGGACRLR
jgi:hypothetical protein